MIEALIQITLAGALIVSQPNGERPNAPVIHRADGAVQPYRLIDIAPAPVTKWKMPSCVTAKHVADFADANLPSLFTIPVDRVPSTGIVGGFHPWAPGYAWQVEFKNGCATRLEVTISK